MTRVTDIRHYEGIQSSDAPAAARSLALYLDTIVVCATARNEGDYDLIPVLCPRRPGHVLCRRALGVVRMEGRIAYTCKVCGREEGIIRGYEGTATDLSRVPYPDPMEDPYVWSAWLDPRDHEVLLRTLLLPPDAGFEVRPDLLALAARAMTLEAEEERVVIVLGADEEMRELTFLTASLALAEESASRGQTLQDACAALEAADVGREAFLERVTPVLSEALRFSDGLSRKGGSHLRLVRRDVSRRSTTSEGAESKETKKVGSRRKKRHAWTFTRSFRAGAFGWRSQPAIDRIKKAVSEIKKVARKDPVLGGEGAVLFLRRLSPAIEGVDGSSGAIGTAANRAIDALVPIIADAPADDATRDRWLDELFEAMQDDGLCYLDSLGDHWGDLCVTRERASRRADDLLPFVRSVFSERRGIAIFHGTTACLSSLLHAGRHEELISLLGLCEKDSIWAYSRYGVLALAAQGRVDEAIAHAETLFPGISGEGPTRAEICERILLDAGRRQEAYDRYALRAASGTSYLQQFRSVRRKYPEKDPGTILKHFIARNPAEEGRWFAAAKELGLLERAARLATRPGVDPKTLNRAARDHAVCEPEFALSVGLASLCAIHEGRGYEITGRDVLDAFDAAMAAARRLGREDDVLRPVRRLLESDPGSLVADMLKGKVGGG